jgi:tetratricopeptide (TPR) repeat protein
MQKIFAITLILILSILACSKKEAGVKAVNEVDPAEILKKANEFYDKGDLDNAFRTYGVIYERYPTSREYIDATLGLSRCYNNLGDYERGMELLFNLVNENIIPGRVPEIYNEMAKYFEVNAGISFEAGISDEAQDFNRAISYYQKAINYPNSDDQNAKAYAQYRIGEVNINMSKFEDAILAFRTTTLNFPNTIWAKVAEERMSEIKDAVDTVLKEPTTPAQNLIPADSRVEESPTGEAPSVEPPTEETPSVQPPAEEQPAQEPSGEEPTSIEVPDSTSGNQYSY